MEILWKAGAVSRVRFAAQRPRALDTAPAFQQILLRRKRREGVAIGSRRPLPWQATVSTLLEFTPPTNNGRSPALWITLQLSDQRLIQRGDQPFTCRLSPF